MSYNKQSNVLHVVVLLMVTVWPGKIPSERSGMARRAAAAPPRRACISCHSY